MRELEREKKREIYSVINLLIDNQEKKVNVKIDITGEKEV